MKSIFIIVIQFLLLSLAVAGEWQVEKSDKNLVKFISDAPVEDFEGTTSAIDGYLFWNGDDITNKSDLYFEVDLNTLDTGIGLRNRHMRENYLETDQFQFTSFKGKIIKSEKLDDKRLKVTVQGKMILHGMERLKTVEGVIEFLDGKINIKSDFPVKLSDYKITVPSIMFYKIDETMDLKLDFNLVEIKE